MMVACSAVAMWGRKVAPRCPRPPHTFLFCCCELGIDSPSPFLLLLLLLTDDMAIMRRHRETCHVSCTQRFPAVGTFDSPRVS